MQAGGGDLHGGSDVFREKRQGIDRTREADPVLSF
jgi:hypothetical protein